jgi:hypothetical protein
VADAMRQVGIDHVNLVSCQQPLISVTEQETLKKSGNKLDDPITGESMMDDAAFSVVFVINLGEPPAEDAEGGQGSRTRK